MPVAATVLPCRVVLTCRFARAACRRIRRAFTLSCAVLAVVSVSPRAFAQKVAIVDRRDNSIKPAHFIVYQACGSDVRACDFVTPDGFAAFRTLASDTGVTVTLHVQRKTPDGPLSFRTGPKSSLPLPREKITLAVVLFGDTAVYRLDSIGVYQVKGSPQLRLDTARFVPGNVICAQLPDRESKQIRQFIDSALAAFEPGVAPVVLPPGIYPCLPMPWVTRASLGRRNGSVNRTVRGALVCFDIHDPACREALADWVTSHQGEPVVP